MLVRRQLMLTVMAGAVGLIASPVLAQEAAEPADGALPEVEVVQPKAAPAAKKAAPAPQYTPTPQPPPAYDYVDAEPPAPGPGERGADGRIISNAPNISPVNPASGILPTDLQNYTGAATRVTTGQIDEQRPKDNHELLTRVPGVIVTQDDGMGRHSNIGIRGSPPRRSRKILVMEDGVPINFSTYLDPSTHYTPPTQRVESVEVLRGTVVAHGPLANHGVVNFRNLNVFGPNETVISAAIGHTEDVKKSVNNFRHVHTRQGLGNAGVVASYSGSDAGGAWDNEELRYNDFYGAIGLQGSRQDLTVSGGYFRQRDKYDEANFVGFEEDFYAYGRKKSNRPGSGFQFQRDLRDGQADFNTYNSDLYRVQLAHNFYIDDDTTLTTRLYYNSQERNRLMARRGGPDNPPGGMRGRNRLYEFWGVDSRIEFANQPLFAGMTYDLQAGVRFEEHSFRNCNSAGFEGEKLTASNTGLCFANRGALHPSGQTFAESGALSKYDADAFSAFVQAAIHVTRDLTITPGVRFESFNVTGHEIHENQVINNDFGKSNHDYVLPAIGFAWEAMPRSTIYGGYHQSVTPHIVRGVGVDDWPLPEERGDNFQIGFRSTAVRGLTLDFAYFHQQIDNYQIKSAVSDGFGNTVYGAVDEVEINGIELLARLESRPFTGGPWNWFGEAVYTYANNKIKRGFQNEILDPDPGTIGPDPIDVSGNQVPEVPRVVAALTLGVEHQSGWDISVTGTYRGSYFVDSQNTAAWTCVNENGFYQPDCNMTAGPGSFSGGDAEGVVGKVPDVWLLSARANYTLPDTGLTLFVSGQNLTNEFYLADLADGAVPGIGRTLWAGFTYKFD